MSKKDYQKVADALAIEFKGATTVEELEAIKRCAIALAKVFAIDNPNFLHSKFYKAIGIPQPTW